MIRIHNTETDEIIDREMNDDEFAIYEADQAAQAEAQAAEASKGSTTPSNLEPSRYHRRRSKNPIGR
jgi:hypothetical protein